MIKSAVIDETKVYRYVLKRIWGRNKKIVNFIMLNPSTADASLDDPTIRRCMSFARAWQYDGIYVTNLFAYRSTDPKNLKANSHILTEDQAMIIGEDNNHFIKKYAFRSRIIVAAWGNHGSLLNRDKQVVRMLQKYDLTLHCLGQSKSNQPKHPLYIAGSTQPTIFER